MPEWRKRRVAMKKFFSAPSLSVASAVCLFLLILGAKWTFIDRYGTDMPDWDQWDAEGLHLYAPWFTHDHFVRELFTPHNEHRIVLTKLQNLLDAVATHPEPAD